MTPERLETSLPQQLARLSFYSRQTQHVAGIMVGDPPVKARRDPPQRQEAGHADQIDVGRHQGTETSDALGLLRRR